MTRQEFINIMDNSIEEQKNHPWYTCNILYTNTTNSRIIDAERRNNTPLVAMYIAMYGFVEYDTYFHLFGSTSLFKRLCNLIGADEADKINQQKERITLLEQFKEDCLEAKLYEVF